MAAKLAEMLWHNVVTAFIIVALPLIIALGFLGYIILKGNVLLWGYGFIALLVAVIVQYPYCKIADRFFLK